MKAKTTAILLLLALTLSSMLASCGNSDGGSTSDTTAASNDTTSVAETTPEYVYPKEDFGGAEHHVLNTSTTWNYYTTFDLEEQTGEVLDDTIFDRNRFIEDTFNIKLKVTDYVTTELSQHLINVILSSEDLYDISYVLGSRFTTLFNTNYLTNLDDVSGFNFDEEWWNQNTNAISGIGGGKYFASDYAALLGFEGTTAMFFNKKLFGDLGIDYPYAEVREGTWTLDRIHELTQLGTDLNGDADYAYDENGNVRYGFVGWDTVIKAYWVGSGVDVLKYENGEAVFGADSERFMNVVEKIAAITSLDGFINLNSTAPRHYENAFMSDRSLVIMGQFKSASSVLREMDSDYGVVPNPKFDETQEKYYSYSPGGLTVIPITNGNADDTAVIADAMAYYSYKNVLPVYYDTVIASKGLRDEDSLEMLDIVRSTMTMQISVIYGWDNSLSSTLTSTVLNGDSQIASIVESNKPKVEASIAATLEALGQ